MELTALFEVLDEVGLASELACQFVWQERLFEGALL